MPRWLRAAATRASRRNRSLRTRVKFWSCPPPSGLRHFTATWRPSDSSRARHTSPMPPRPIRSSNRYRPWMSLLSPISCDRPRKVRPALPCLAQYGDLSSEFVRGRAGARSEAGHGAQDVFGRELPAQTCGNAAQQGAGGAQLAGGGGGVGGFPPVQLGGVRGAGGGRPPGPPPPPAPPRRGGG